MKRTITSRALAASLGLIAVGGALVSRPRPVFHSRQLPARISWSAAANDAVAGRVVAVSAATTQRVVAAYDQLPLVFEANRGQTAAQVKFLSRSRGYTMFLTPTEAVLSIHQPAGVEPRSAAEPRVADLFTDGILDGKLTESYLSAMAAPMANQPSSASVRMKLLGANPAPRLAGLEELPGKSNYLIGNDPQQWRTDIPAYAKVKYQDVYPGVDLIYYGNQRQLEYDFVVAPGADPNTIRLRFEGAEKLEVDGEGNLILHVADSEVIQRAPNIYQDIGGFRQPISGHYVLKADENPPSAIRHPPSVVGFQVAAYDAAKPLVIDPVLIYSTYLGGSGTDRGLAPAVDRDGNVYVTGETSSTNFPTTNPLQPAPGGGLDAFVTKLNASGSAVVYSTYLGGSGNESGIGIAVDDAGNAYVSGRTASTNFPTANPLQPTYGGGAFDAFVAKLNPAGSALVYSTYLGGSGQDEAFDLRLDAAASAYVSGRTASTNFPTANALQPANAGDFDAFVAKLNPAGSALVYSTYLGGSGNDGGLAPLAVDSGGNAYLAGSTSSTNFPTVNPLQPTFGGGTNDAFVAKLNAAGSALVYSTYLGGSGNDPAAAIAVDPSGNAYVVGRTFSTDFPTVNPLQPARAGGNDAFVAKLNAAGSALIYSTYLGGGGDENIFGNVADAAGNVYVSGWTSSPDFPTANPLQPAYGGGTTDAFVAKLNATGSVLVYSTYLGGSGEDRGDYIVLDAAGNAYMTGWTASPNFPTVNPVQPTNGGGTFDAFVVKLSADARSTALATVSAASFSAAAVASESLVSAFGSGLASTTLAATTTPLPTSLGGASIKVKDSSGMERLAPLIFVSPTQLNFQIPPGTTVGTAAVTVGNNNATIALGTVQVTGVAPGLFAANGNGQGVAAALALRVQAGNVQSYEPVAVFEAAQKKFVPLPIELGPETDQVFLVLFGTGLRYRSSLATVMAKLGGVDGQVVYAGAQPDLVGLDQVNVRLPRGLIGRGEVDVALMVDGQAANTVRVSIK